MLVTASHECSLPSLISTHEPFILFLLLVLLNWRSDKEALVSTWLSARFKPPECDCHFSFCQHKLLAMLLRGLKPQVRCCEMDGSIFSWKISALEQVPCSCALLKSDLLLQSFFLLSGCDILAAGHVFV